MTSSTRRHATLLLWLMLALLPLRGWAMGVMDVQGLVASTAAEAASGCHHEGADCASHAHSLCSVCHAAVAPASVLPVVMLDDAATAVVADVVQGHCDPRPSDPYKPPRI